MLKVKLSPTQNKLLFDLCGVLRISKRLTDNEKLTFGTSEKLAELAKSLDKNNIPWSIQNKVANMALTTDYYIQTCINKVLEV